MCLIVNNNNNLYPLYGVTMSPGFARQQIGCINPMICNMENTFYSLQLVHIVYYLMLCCVIVLYKHQTRNNSLINAKFNSSIATEIRRHKSLKTPYLPICFHIFIQHYSTYAYIHMYSERRQIDSRRDHIKANTQIWRSFWNEKSAKKKKNTETKLVNWRHTDELSHPNGYINGIR